MHNPYALSPEGEFQTPEGEWWLTCRSIVYDSWLFWSDALPYEMELRQQLDMESFNNITSLAKRLHVFHVSLPGYKQLNESPFKVSKWWDPTETDPQWSSGRSCLFTIENFEAEDLINYLPKRTSRPLIKLKPVSVNFIEVYLPPDKSEVNTSQSSLPLDLQEKKPSSCPPPTRKYRK